MSRIAFVLDRIFRKFGLSGKSFIPMLIGTGCGIPGVMASRTIENERDRRMTIMTTTFIPCGAKVPFIAMIAGAIFGGSAIVSTSAYFIGMAAIIISGIMLKKQKDSPATRLPSLWSFRLTTGPQSAPFFAQPGSAVGLSSRKPAQSSPFPQSLFGSQLTSALLTAISECSARIKLIPQSLPQSAAHLLGSLSPSAGATGRQLFASITGLVAKENIVGKYLPAGTYHVYIFAEGTMIGQQAFSMK